MSQGIYAITNDVTPRVYIGASRNLNARIATHLDPSDDSRHSSNAWLQQAIKRHGREHFKAQVLATCHDLDNNTIAALEGVFLLYWHFVMDRPVFNVSLIAGEGFVDSVKTLENLTETCQRVIDGMHDGSIKVIPSERSTRLEFPQGGTITFFDWHEDLFEKVLPFARMMQIQRVPTFNTDVVQKMPFQDQFIRDYETANYNACRLVYEHQRLEEEQKRILELSDEERETQEYFDEYAF